MILSFLIVVIIALLGGSLLFLPAAVVLADAASLSGASFASARWNVLAITVLVPTGVAAFAGVDAAIYWGLTFCGGVVLAAVIGFHLRTLMSSSGLLMRASIAAAIAGSLLLVSSYVRVCSWDGTQCAI